MIFFVTRKTPFTKMENDAPVEENSIVNNKESSVKDLNLSRSSIKSTERSSTHSNTGSIKSEKDVHFSKNSVSIKSDKQDPSLTVPHKIIANWRHACNRTKDRTRDLLKRWRTVPEYESDSSESVKKNYPNLEKTDSHTNGSGWSVHVWTTWVDRFSVDTSEYSNGEQSYRLTPTQSNKFSYFFTTLLDHDQDNLINEDDFEAFIERLRHFADWSTNSQEFNILREVERGFMETFLQEIVDDKLGFEMNDQVYITQEGWLYKWAKLISGCKNLSDFPIWLQYFVRTLFQVINKTGTGIISRDELKSFYSSVLGFSVETVDQILDLAYKAMTSNGDHPLNYRIYQLCFANFLLGRYPNGPGQYILGAIPTLVTSALFPIDYSALNTQPEDLEQYAPDHKTNRRSVVV